MGIHKALLIDVDYMGELPLFELEDIDLSGMLGYTVNRGQTTYFILQEDEDGNNERKIISKETFEYLQKVKHAKD